MKKFIFLLVILIITSGLSFYFREPLNLFYLKVYYRIMTDEKSCLEKALKLYEEDQHEKLAQFIGPLCLIYPENHSLKRIAGLNLIALGNNIAGAEIISSSIDNDKLKISDIAKIAKILYQSGNYGDLVSLYDRGILNGNVNGAFYYGVSLYHVNRIAESFKLLKYARDNGYLGGEIDFYIGLNLEKLEQNEEAIAYLKSAYKQDKKNQLIQKALIRVYRKLEKFSEAEEIIRKI